MRPSRQQERSLVKSKSPSKRRSPGRPKSVRVSSPGRRKISGRPSKSPSRRSSRVGSLTPTRRSPIKRSAVRLFEPEVVPMVSPQPQLNYDSEDSIEFYWHEHYPGGSAQITAPVAEATPSSSLQAVDWAEYNSMIVPCEDGESGVKRNVFEKFEEKVRLFPGRNAEDCFLRFVFKRLYDCDMGHISDELTLDFVLFMFMGAAISSFIYLKNPQVPILSLCLNPLVFYVCLMSFILIISLLPLPNYLNYLFPSKKVEHQCNGALCLIAFLLSAGIYCSLSPDVPATVARHFSLDWVPPCLEFLDKHELGLLMAAWVIGIVLTISSLLFGERKNQDATINILGVQIWEHIRRPLRLLGYDLKLLVLRTELVTEIMLVLLYTYDHVYRQDQLEMLPVLVYSGYRLYLCTLRLLFECVVVSSKSVQANGNCFYVGRLLMPYLNVLPLRFHGEISELNPWHWITVGVCFGFMVYTQRLTFRLLRRPKIGYGSSSGKKVVVSGLRSISRHPEYLGAIFGEVAAQSLLMSVSWIDLVILFRIAFLENEAAMNDEQSFLEFRLDWVRYCMRTGCLLNFGTSFDPLA